MKYYLRGGVGDFLQCLPYMMANPDKEYLIHTHFRKAKEFIEGFGVLNCKYYYFDNIEEHDSTVDVMLEENGENTTKNISPCPRYFYSKIQFFEKYTSEALNILKGIENKNGSKPLIGIHPFGSSFANTTYSSFNLPQKNIPSEILQEVIKPEFNYIIFGTEKELQGLDLPKFDNVFYTNHSIETCLSLVTRCSKFIGSDSCFKTMSSMNMIPTLCLVGSFDDQIRDFFFINQYQSDSILVPIKVSDYQSQNQEIVEKINEFLSAP
jgi:hypothetical protein